MPPIRLKKCNERPHENLHYPASRTRSYNVDYDIDTLGIWESAWHEWAKLFLEELREEVKRDPAKLGPVLDAINAWAEARHQAMCTLIVTLNAIPSPLEADPGVPPIITGSTKPPPPPFGGGMG